MIELRQTCKVREPRKERHDKGVATWQNRQLENLHGEKWRDIQGYEGFYRVSNRGRVKSLERQVYSPQSSTRYRTVRSRILKLNPVTSRGRTYATTYLYKNGNRKTVMVHRLVAETFIPNPTNKPEVDHVETSESLVNSVGNLRWATRSENAYNSPKRVGTSSKFRGVSFYSRDGTWRAAIAYNGERTHIGYFQTEFEAATAYNEAALEKYGELAQLNKLPIAIAA